MEMTISTGTHYFLWCAPLVVSGVTQSERVRTVPLGARWSVAGRPFRPAPVDPIGFDLPTTDRMRMSASEP
jgi:hypothetical protein